MVWGKRTWRKLRKATSVLSLSQEALVGTDGRPWTSNRPSTAPTGSVSQIIIRCIDKCLLWNITEKTIGDAQEADDLNRRTKERLEKERVIEEQVNKLDNALSRYDSKLQEVYWIVAERDNSGACLHNYAKWRGWKNPTVSTKLQKKVEIARATTLVQVANLFTSCSKQAAVREELSPFRSTQTDKISAVITWLDNEGLNEAVEDVMSATMANLEKLEKEVLSERDKVCRTLQGLEESSTSDQGAQVSVPDDLTIHSTVGSMMPLSLYVGNDNPGSPFQYACPHPASVRTEELRTVTRTTDSISYVKSLERTLRKLDNDMNDIISDRSQLTKAMTSGNGYGTQPTASLIPPT